MQRSLPLAVLIFGALLSMASGAAKIELENSTTKVVLDPDTGGRVVAYALHGKDVLYHAPQEPVPGRINLKPDAGRFDIGPEKMAPPRGDLWDGSYKVEVLSQRSVRLTSVDEPEPMGIRIIREFTLASDSSHLRVTQTLVNVGKSTKRYHHWSRTLATGGGICIVPLTPGLSRFPEGYILYGTDNDLIYHPAEHPAVRVRENTLEILDTPLHPKFGIDSHAGWLAYITTDDLLFVKRFPTYPNRRYGELSGYTVSIWYYLDEACELEPIGPTEVLEPGQSASFTEDWYLLDFAYPRDRLVDLAVLKDVVDRKTKESGPFVQEP